MRALGALYASNAHGLGSGTRGYDREECPGVDVQIPALLSYQQLSTALRVVCYLLVNTTSAARRSKTTSSASRRHNGDDDCVVIACGSHMCSYIESCFVVCSALWLRTSTLSINI